MKEGEDGSILIVVRIKEVSNRSAIVHLEESGDLIESFWLDNTVAKLQIISHEKKIVFPTTPPQPLPVPTPEECPDDVVDVIDTEGCMAIGDAPAINVEDQYLPCNGSTMDIIFSTEDGGCGDIVDWELTDANSNVIQTGTVIIIKIPPEDIPDLPGLERTTQNFVEIDDVGIGDYTISFAAECGCIRHYTFSVEENRCCDVTTEGCESCDPSTGNITSAYGNGFCQYTCGGNKPDGVYSVGGGNICCDNGQQVDCGEEVDSGDDDDDEDEEDENRCIDENGEALPDDRYNDGKIFWCCVGGMETDCSNGGGDDDEEDCSGSAASSGSTNITEIQFGPLEIGTQVRICFDVGDVSDEIYISGGIHQSSGCHTPENSQCSYHCVTNSSPIFIQIVNNCGQDPDNQNNDVAYWSLTYSCVGTCGGNAEDVETREALLPEIRPNPNFGVFDVIIADTNMTTMEIFDIQGRRIHAQTIELGKNQISLRDADSGVYIVKVSGTNATAQFKKMIITK